jgi:hypothetical protein
MHPDSRVVQPSFYLPCLTRPLPLSRQFAGDPPHLHRAAFPNPRNQPGQIAYSGDPLLGSQLQDFFLPGILHITDWHRLSPFGTVSRTLSSVVYLANQLFSNCRVAIGIFRFFQDLDGAKSGCGKGKAFRREYFSRE